MTTLTVVLISRNQAWNIARLIESALKETASMPGTEIILVDSASSDKTVEIASQYPIRILRLHDTQRLSPSAGRFMGYKYTTGELILFVDGDNEMYPGWLEKAMKIFAENPDLAGLAGPRVPLLKSATDADKPPLVDRNLNATVKSLYADGTAMFRREALQKAGQFNPYIYSDEEPELCVRLRHAGYRMLHTKYPIAYDYTDPAEEIATRIARWRRNLYLGFGQNLRNFLGKEVFWTYCRERGMGLMPLVILILGVISLLTIIFTGNKVWFVTWLLSVAAIVMAYVIKDRSIYQASVSILERLLIMDGTVKGFLLKPQDPNSYPGLHDVIK